VTPAIEQNRPVYRVQTDIRIVQQPDERMNQMLLENLDELAPSVEVLLHEISGPRSPRPWLRASGCRPQH
jgi:3'-phosphoadenosine 5'-phosphosulfate (PAPS) 3'-phosphatase